MLYAYYGQCEIIHWEGIGEWVASNVSQFIKISQRLTFCALASLSNETTLHDAREEASHAPIVGLKQCKIRLSSSVKSSRRQHAVNLAQHRFTVCFDFARPARSDVRALYLFTQVTRNAARGMCLLAVFFVTTIDTTRLC